MSRSHKPLSQLALAVLALWLGLWPAADAMTGASQTIVMAPVTETPVPNAAATECLLAEAAVLNCCEMATSPDAPESNCCGRSREQCVRCFSLGGMVLIAVSQWSLEPDLALCGTVADAVEAEDSQTLQPPVPPPWAIS